MKQDRISAGLATAWALFLVLLMAGPGHAQSAGGTILGTMTDPSGAVIPNAKIEIKNLATNVTRTLTTNESGFFSAPNLPPAVYQITATAPGFRTRVLTEVPLAVGAEQVVNMQMVVGQVTQTVEVAGGAAAVDLASSTLSHVVQASTIRELPLNGRDWTLLATLQPGVSIMAAQDTADNRRAQRGNGIQMSISGGRPSENNYRLNGITINDYANTGPGSALGSNLGVDAIQEFSVLTSTYSAEYGRTTGGVINAATKSGTNEIHGTGYYFHRNSVLDARNFFDRTKPPFRRHQFGASVGGPLLRDRTFWFADFEGLRAFKGVSGVASVPSAAAREGRLSGRPTPVPVNPAVKPFLAIYPLPNTPTPGDIGRFFFSSGRISSEDFVTGKMDHKFSDKDSLNGTYYFDDAQLDSPDEFNNKAISSASRRQGATLEESHIFGPALVNTARLGFSRAVAANGLSQVIFNPLLKDTSLGFLPGRNVGEIEVTGLKSFSGGLDSFENNSFWYTSYQVSDDLFITRRTHSIKVGVNVERIWENFNAPNLPSGRFAFSSLADFLEGRPDRMQAGLPGTDSIRGERQTVVGAYVQDDIRWRPNLTLNLGLRYETASVPDEVNGKKANLVNMTDRAPTVGFLFNNNTRRNFAPRVGFAWDPFGSGKTSVRGGFGVFDVLPLVYLFTNRFPRTVPFFAEAVSSGLQNVPNVFPKGGFAFLTADTTRFRTINIEANPSRSYKLQWNLNVQRELVQDVTLSVGYVGARGVHLPTGDEDADIVLPAGRDAGGYFWPVSSIPPRNRRINTNFGRIARTRFNANSFYQGLQTSLTKRLSRGLQIQGSYTWQKTIDTGSNTFSNNEYLNTISNPFPFDDRLNRGPADFDIAHNFVLNFLWQVPTPGNWPAAARLLLGGWQLGGIYQARSGVPLTPVISADQAQTGNAFTGQSGGQRPNLLLGPGCDRPINPGNRAPYIKTECFSAVTIPLGRLGNLGRGRLTNPGLSNFDFSLFKNHSVPRISETFKIQFRAEFFNVLNQHPFGVMEASQYTIFDRQGRPTGNQINSTSVPERQIQFGIKFIW